MAYILPILWQSSCNDGLKSRQFAFGNIDRYLLFLCISPFLLQKQIALGKKIEKINSLEQETFPLMLKDLFVNLSLTAWLGATVPRIFRVALALDRSLVDKQ